MFDLIYCFEQKGRTALHVASGLGNCEAIKLLLDYGASLNSRDRKGNTSLHLAVAGNHSDAVALLVSKGAFINAINNVSIISCPSFFVYYFNGVLMMIYM